MRRPGEYKSINKRTKQKKPKEESKEKREEKKNKESYAKNKIKLKSMEKPRFH